MKKIFENKYICWAVTALSVITVALLVYFSLLRINHILSVIKHIAKILLPFLYGCGIAYILNQLMKFFERTILKKMPSFIKPSKLNKVRRICSITLSTLIMISIIVILIRIIIPQLFSSFDILVDNIPTYFKNLKNWLDNILVNKPYLEKIVNDNYNNVYNNTLKYINDSLLPERKSIITNLSSGFLSIVKTIVNVVIGFIISLYILFNKELFIGQFKKILFAILPIEKVNVILSNIRYTDRVFNGFFIGKIIDSLIIGVICYVFLLIFKIPFPLVIALIIGITNIIPYFGPIIGAIPSALFILMVNPSKCLLFLIFIFILQQFDGNILGPKILGSKTGLKSFWVLFAIILFGGLFGFVGMIIGVPLFSVIYAMINAFCNKNLEKKKLSTNTNDYLYLREIQKKNGKYTYEHEESDV